MIDLFDMTWDEWVMKPSEIREEVRELIPDVFPCSTCNRNRELAFTFAVANNQHNHVACYNPHCPYMDGVFTMQVIPQSRRDIM